MELLLLLSLGLVGYVLWKQSRGEQPSVAGVAGGCLGIGCLGIVLLWVAAIVAFWLLIQLLGDVDLSLSGFDPGGSGGGNQGEDPLRIPERET